MGTLIRRLLWITIVVSLFAVRAEAWIKGRVSQTFEIGPVTEITVDGDLSDWDAEAFAIGPLATVDGRVPAPDEHDIRVRVGWGDGSLWLAIELQDDELVLAPAERARDRYDGVRIRLSDGLTGSRYTIVDVAPPSGESGRAHVRVDSRGSVRAEVEAAGRTQEGGSSLEVRIPLADLGGTESGRRFALQILATDRDRGGNAQTYAWFPWDDLSVGGMSHTVGLSSSPGPSIRGVAHGSYPDLLKTRVRVVCDPELAGRRVTFKDRQSVLAEGDLELKDGRAHATLTCDMPELGAPYEQPVVEIEGAGSLAVTIPNADERRAWHFSWHWIRFRDYVFSGNAFPRPRLDEPLLAEHLAGPYSLETEYYDRNYNPVSTPDVDGRYGAVVTIRTTSGRTYRRFRTLYRFSGWIPWWERDVFATIDLPEEFGIDPAVVDGKASVVADQLKLMFWAGLSRDQRIGAFLAGLKEAVPGEADRGFYDAVWERDRAWWVGLKRKLYGMDPVQPVEAPVGVFKGRAQELVAGSEADAGFLTGAGKAIDEVCKTWWEETDEPMSVCVARNGRIVHLASYGFRDGRPVTLTTKAPIASITKLLTGVQMAIVVDQKRVNIDEPISSYLPAFENVDGAEAFTVRRAMNHTSGLEGHWGDEDNDFEEQIAGYLPEAEIGRTYQYNGTGFAIAGKVIEAVSGETLPGFLKRHLLQPLGCEDTDVSGTSQDGRSTALDLARIGQLLLNGGAYGDFRFFEYEAMQELLPRPLSPDLPGTHRKEGMGTRFFEGEGLGKGTFGHGARSGTIFRVDPENKLVITVARWRTGKDYEKHKRNLFDTIVSQIQDTVDIQQD